MFQSRQPLQSLIPGIPGLGNPLGIQLGSGVIQSAAVIFQLLLPLFQFCQPEFQLPALLSQVLQFLKLAFQFFPLGLGLGQQTGAVVTNPVFQFLQFPAQMLRGTAFVTGGDQRIEPAAQGVILGHRKIAETDESGPAEYRLFHAQQHLAAVGGGQFRHGKACVGFVGPEFSQRNPPGGTAFDGDVPALPVQVDATGHGGTGPGGVSLLIRQGGFGGFRPGIQAVKHGSQKSAPGAFAPFVGGFNDVQTRF